MKNKYKNESNNKGLKVKRNILIEKYIHHRKDTHTHIYVYIHIHTHTSGLTDICHLPVFVSIYLLILSISFYLFVYLFLLNAFITFFIFSPYSLLCRASLACVCVHVFSSASSYSYVYLFYSIILSIHLYF